MARISSDQIGLRDAADIFGVSIDTLRRRIRDNQLDEAVLVQGPFGATWVLPRASLATIAEREGWEEAGTIEVDPSVSRVSAPTHAPVQAGAPLNVSAPLAAVGVDATVTNSTVTDSTVTDNTVTDSTVIDLTEPVTQPEPVLIASTGSGPAAGGPPPPALSGTAVQGAQLPAVPTGGPSADDLVLEVTAAVAEELARGLSDNVHAELSAVREAITAAEVKAVAADARTDALRAEKGRLEAQLKRAEADIEYWRSQHDRLDKDLDRERTVRVTSDKAKSVAESETRVVRERVAELTVEVSDTQTRERALIATEAALQAELDQATMVMGWWSRRRLTKLQARSSGRTPPPPAGD